MAKGKQLIADWQWAWVCQDEKLMDKIVSERIKMESEILKMDEDFVYQYYTGLYE